MPSKYLCAEPRIAQPGLGDPGPLGAGLGRLLPPGGFVPLRVPGARQAGSGPVGRVLCHRSRSVLARVQITLPSLSVPAPSETLVCKPDDARQGRSGAGRVLLGVGTGARPPTHPYRAVPPLPTPVESPRPGREATSPAAEWKPVRQVTNRWVVTVISQRMRHRSPGHSKLIRSDQHPHPTPARATNTPPRANKA